MYSLLLLLSWLPLGVSGIGAPPAPERLRVQSVNFRHVLLWERGAGTSPDTTYTVSFHTDSSWPAPVPGCEIVLDPLECDLSDVCSDPDETYYLNVTALPRTEQSSRFWKFLPIEDAELQPPVFQVVPCNSSLCVDLDAPVPQLRSLYESFWYELKIESSVTQKPRVESFTSLERRIVKTTEGSQTCVSIRIADHILSRYSKFSQAQCVSGPSPTHKTTVSLLALLLVLVPVFYTVHKCRPKKPSLPSVLTSIIHSEEMVSVCCHPAAPSLLLIINPAPPEGHTGEDSSSGEDSSEDDYDSAETQETTDVCQYKSKASLCSLRPSASSQETSKAVELPMEEPEEVDLLTLTFCRDNDTDVSAVPLPEMELLMCDVVQEQAESEEEFGDESFHTGYMSR